MRVKVDYTQGMLTGEEHGTVYTIQSKLLTQQEHHQHIEWQKARKSSLRGQKIPFTTDDDKIARPQFKFEPEPQPWISSKQFAHSKVGIIEVLCSRMYGFRVLCQNRDGLVSASPMAEFSTANLPNPPRGLRSVAGSLIQHSEEDPRVSNYLWGRVQVTWQRPLETGGSNIVGYVIQYRQSECVTVDGITHHLYDWHTINVSATNCISSSSTTNSYVIDRLAQWEEYDFRVAAINEGAGQGPFSHVTQSKPQAALQQLEDVYVRCIDKETMLVCWNTPQKLFPENEPGQVVFTGFFVEYRPQPARTLWTRKFIPCEIHKQRRHAPQSDGHIQARYTTQINGLRSGIDYHFRVAISMRPMTQVEREKAAGDCFYPY